MEGPPGKDQMNPNWDPNVNNDEATIAQERRIEKEIAEKICLIGDKCDLVSVAAEYPAEDNAFQDKIK
ncbi:hypothetical protein B4U80_09117, partial [Leptotrombidium deliense]